MTSAPGAPRPLFVVIYPYKFHDFVYDLLELSEIRKYCDVEVWDLSPLTNPAFRKAVKAPGASSEEVSLVHSIGDLYRRLRRVKERSLTAKVCILNELTNNSLRELTCNRMVAAFTKAGRMPVLDLYIGGVPLAGFASARPDASAKPPGFIAKARRFIRTTSGISETMRKAAEILFTSVGKSLRHPTTHRLVAGTDWENRAEEHANSRGNIQLIRGHSHDYSNNLLYRLSNPDPPKNEMRTAVMLDGAGPGFGSDAVLVRRKVYFTADVWYPALSRFFDKLEASTGVTVEIAGHYKTTHPPIAPVFGNRRVFYRRTIEMVRNAEFVVTRASTAISHAVVSRKPVVFIYSNQLAQDLLAMRSARAMASLLGNDLVNVDDPPADVNALLKVNAERYRAYEDACLTSAREKGPNCIIILEEVMGIATSAGARAQ